MFLKSDIIGIAIVSDSTKMKGADQIALPRWEVRYLFCEKLSWNAFIETIYVIDAGTSPSPTREYAWRLDQVNIIHQ